MPCGTLDKANSNAPTSTVSAILDGRIGHAIKASGSGAEDKIGLGQLVVDRRSGQSSYLKSAIDFSRARLAAHIFRTPYPWRELLGKVAPEGKAHIFGLLPGTSGGAVIGISTAIGFRPQIATYLFKFQHAISGGRLRIHLHYDTRLPCNQGKDFRKSGPKGTIGLPIFRFHFGVATIRPPKGTRIEDQAP